MAEIVDWKALHARAHDGLQVHDIMVDKWLDLLQALVEGKMDTSEFNRQWMEYLEGL